MESFKLNLDINELNVHPALKATVDGKLDQLEIILEEELSSLSEDEDLGFINRIKTSQGATCLIIAASLGHLSIIESLLCWEADCNIKTVDPTNQKPTKGSVPGRAAIHFATRNGHVDCVKALLNARCNANVADQEGVTPLHVAVRMNYEDIVRLLVRNKGIDIDKPDSKGRTALHWACILGHDTLVRILLDNEADTHITDRESRTCFHYCCEYGNFRCLVLLNDFLNFKEVNRVDNKGLTCLHLSCLNGHKECARYLVAHKEIILDAQDDKGRTVLHACTYGGHLGCLDLLLSTPAASNLLYKKDKLHRSPFFYLTFTRKHSCLLSLLKRINPILLREQDITGATALHWFSYYGINKFLAILQHEKVLIKENVNNWVDSKGNTLLHYAAKQGQTSTLSFLINSLQADPSIRNAKNQTPLHLAVKKDYYETAHLLLSKGADINLPDITGRTPSILAARYGSFHCLQQLIERGAKVNSQDGLRRSPLHWSCISANSQCTQILLKEGAKVEVGDLKKRTPLHLCCISGDIESAKLLIDYGTQVNARDVNQLTPIHMASYFGHMNILNLLLERGGKLESSKDSSGLTPLHYSCITDNLEITKLLLDRGLDVNAKDKMNRSPLHLACISATKNNQSTSTRAELVCELIRRGSEINCEDTFGRTPLFYAADDLDVMRILLGRNDSDLQKRDHSGNTILHWIAFHGNQLEGAKQVLATAPNLLKISNIKGWTPLHMVSFSGNRKILNLFIDSGASVNYTDIMQRTPLHVAAFFGHAECLRILILEEGTVNQLDKDNRTPLFHAATSGKQNCSECLLARGADVNITDVKGQYPLHVACKGKSSEHVEVADLLLDESDNFDRQDNYGVTPLLLCCWNGHYKLAKKLVVKGANVNASEKTGITPLIAAAAKGHLQCVQLLIKEGANANHVDSIGFNAFLWAKRRNHPECASVLRRVTRVRKLKKGIWNAIVQNRPRRTRPRKAMDFSPTNSPARSSSPGRASPSDDKRAQSPRTPTKLIEAHVTSPRSHEPFISPPVQFVEDAFRSPPLVPSPLTSLAKEQQELTEAEEMALSRSAASVISKLSVNEDSDKDAGLLSPKAKQLMAWHPLQQLETKIISQSTNITEQNHLVSSIKDTMQKKLQMEMEINLLAKQLTYAEHLNRLKLYRMQRWQRKKKPSTSLMSESISAALALKRTPTKVDTLMKSHYFQIAYNQNIFMVILLLITLICEIAILIHVI